LKIKKIYQTLEDRDNPDYIEENTPFKCKRKNAWLGVGYYFWDTFIENAHWWGKFSYHNSYVICEFKSNFNSEICFDLVGETEHMLEFESIIELLKKKNLITNNTTVSRILSFIRDVIDFKYEAIRVYGINSISNKKEENKDYIFQIPFVKKGYQYLDYKPLIQICIFEKNGLNLRESRIVYPDKYIDDYVI